MRLPGRLAAALRSPAGWIAVGAGLRLVHILTLGNRTYFGDTVEYEAAALRYLHGSGVDQATPRAPLYPLIMAATFWFGGEGHFLLTRLITLVLSVVLMLVGAKLAERLGGPSAGTLAAAGIAISPTILFVSGLLYPTTLYMLLLLSFTLVAWDMSLEPTVARGAQLGALFGLGWLTDQVFLAPAFAVGVWLVSRRGRPRKPFVVALATAAVVAAAVALPYLNLLQHSGGDGVFMRKAQTVLYSARTDPELSRERWIRLAPGAKFQARSPLGFVQSESALFARAPLAYVHDWLWEFLHFFRPVADRVQSRNRYTQGSILLIGGLHFVALLTLALLGLGYGAGPRSGRIVLASVVVATAGFYAFFFTQTRYRIPVESHLVVLAALGVQAAFPRVTAWLAGAAAARGPEPTGT